MEVLFNNMILLHADIEFARFAKRTMLRNGRNSLPRTIEEATLLYVELVHEIGTKSKFKIMQVINLYCELILNCKFPQLAVYNYRVINERGIEDDG